MKVCPSCWSTNVTIRVPQWGIWICKDCGWEGIEVLEFPELPDDILEKMKEIKKMENLGKEREAMKMKEKLEEMMKKLEKKKRGS
jgi:hypothetical protein